jgi:hypothetical protein
MPDLGPISDELAIQLAARRGCHAEDVVAYLRLQRKTLASLYILISHPNPSPTLLYGLAIRYAMDVRTPIEGDVWRFAREQTPKGWLITEYPSSAHRTMSVRLPHGKRTSRPMELGSYGNAIEHCLGRKVRFFRSFHAWNP